MYFKSLRWYQYNRRLKAPLLMMGQRLTRRHGIVVEGVTDSGLSLWSEAAPLPGLHRETVEQVLTLRHEAGFLLTNLNSPEREPNMLTTAAWPPSLRFALQGLWLQIFAINQNLTLHTALNPGSASSVRLNALVSMSDDENSLKAIVDNFHSIKIKVGRHSPVKEASFVNRIARMLRKGTTIRLDANRSWSLEEAVLFTDKLQAPIEYIEEPLKKPSDLESFYTQTGLPFALDESLRDLRPDAVQFPGGCRALVLKPSLHGIFKTLAWARAAQNAGIDCTISSVFESAVGLNLLAHLAAALAAKTAHGLDTSRFFENDLAKLDTPTADSITAMQQIEPDRSVLQEVP